METFQSCSWKQSWVMPFFLASSQIRCQCHGTVKGVGGIKSKPFYNMNKNLREFSGWWVSFPQSSLEGPFEFSCFLNFSSFVENKVFCRHSFLENDQGEKITSCSIKQWKMNYYIKLNIFEKLLSTKWSTLRSWQQEKEGWQSGKVNQS